MPVPLALSLLPKCLARAALLVAALSLAATPALAAKMWKTTFSARDADPAASKALGQQRVFLAQDQPHRGQLALFLHGAGVAESCGPGAHLRFMAELGFHVFAPCYVSDYGVENCGDDIAGCRLEAFEGVDHHAFVDIAPTDAIEPRIVSGLRYLAAHRPDDGWESFLDAEGGVRWERIVLTGHSHGASTAALIGKVRDVERIVLLAGPYDRGQEWLAREGLTPPERQFGLTHPGDRQHEGHLEAFERLGLPGVPVDVDGAAPPFGDSHRLVTKVESKKPHSSVRAGGVSPKVGDTFVLAPVWRYLYGAVD